MKHPAWPRRSTSISMGIGLVALTLLPACGGDDTTTSVSASASSGGTDGGPDGEAPRVTAATPGEAAAGVPVDLAEITVTFNEAMDVSAGAPQMDGVTLGAATWKGNTVSFPVSGLEAATSYRLALEGFVDTSGNALDGEPYLLDGALDFMTANAIDSDPPTVVTSSPVEGQADVALDLQQIVVTFKEPMDTSAATASLDGGASILALKGAWAPDGTSIAFKLAAPLEASTAYTLDLSGFSDKAKNPLNGQPYVGDGALDFTTMALIDATAPVVVASSPAEGSASVLPTLPEIVIDFSEAMDPSITTVPLLIGANALPLAGVWSAGDTRITFPIPSELAISVAFTLDLSGMQDVAGNPLDAADPYLGDGRLDFITFLPTGETCADAMILSQASLKGQAYVWTIPAGSVKTTEGQFACDPNTIGPDAVIEYTKKSTDLAGGGQLLHVTAMTSQTSTSYYLNLEVVGDNCSAASGTLEKCLWYKHDWDTYLDVPAGTYYIWVAKNSPASVSLPFPETTVSIEEIPAGAAEGEGCFAPYTTASSIYTPPAMPGGPHTWTIPATINSFDMGVTWGEPGSISCDDTSPYGDVHGVDAVIAFDKTSATSVLKVDVQNLAPVLTASDLDVEVLSVCDPSDPSKISRRCGADADAFSFTAGGSASTHYVWVATESTGEEFQGASVAITEIYPGVGESLATAEPIVASGPITPTSAMRLDPPSCFPAAGNVHWYSYTAVNDVVAIGADIPGSIALFNGSSAELRCAADASKAALGLFVGAGTTVYIAVETAGPIGSLTISDIVYTGLTGALTDLNVTWPSSSTGDYGMAVSASEIFLLSSTKIFAAPKAGNAMAVEHGDADGITATHLGYDITFADGGLFSLDTTSTTNASRLFHIYEESTMTWGPTTWDLSPSYPATSPGYALTYDGTNVVMATRNTSGKVDFYSVPPSAPAIPVALGTNTGVDYVVGIAADSQFFYVAGVGQAGEGEGVFRIARTAVAGPAVQIAKLDTSVTRNTLAVDSYVNAQNLYVRQYSPSDIHVIVDPGGASAVHAGAIATLGDVGDYAMAYDPLANVIYFYETESDNTGRLVMMQ